jgi:hypothetical protein
MIVSEENGRFFQKKNRFVFISSSPCSIIYRKYIFNNMRKTSYQFPQHAPEKKYINYLKHGRLYALVFTEDNIL